MTAWRTRLRVSLWTLLLFSHSVIRPSSLQGEKYLVLKKKYRQMLQERHAKHAGSDGDGQRRPRAPAAAQWDATDASACPPQRREQRGEPRSCGHPDGAAEVNLKPACCSVPGASQQQHGAPGTTSSPLHGNDTRPALSALDETLTEEYCAAENAFFVWGGHH